MGVSQIISMLPLMPSTPLSYSILIFVRKYLAACHVGYAEAAIFPYVGR